MITLSILYNYLCIIFIAITIPQIQVFNNCSTTLATMSTMSSAVTVPLMAAALAASESPTAFCEDVIDPDVSSGDNLLYYQVK